MNKKLLVNLTWIAVCAGFVFFLFLDSSDEKQIRARLDSLAESAAIKGPEHPFEKLAKGRSLSTFFTDPVTLSRVAKDGELVKELLSHKELAQKIAVARGHFTTASITVDKLNLQSKGDSASANLLVKGVAEGVSDSEELRDRAEFRIDLEKIDGEWYISAVEHVPSRTH